MLIICIIFISSNNIEAQNEKISLLTAPAGFSIEIFAEDIKSPRQMSEGMKYIYVASGPMGEIYALVDNDKDNKIDSKITLASGLNNSRGVTFKDGDLYFAEVDKIWVIENIEEQLDLDPNKLPDKKLVTDNLPSDAWHGWKWIKHGPDGKLYVPVGAPCNVCLKDDPRYASIMRLNEGAWEFVATGVRNSVGFDWHPDTKKLYFTDNGRDWLGDDSPSCELNVVEEENSFYGFPYVHANDVLDPEYGADSIEYVKPIVDLGPHVAPTGTAFYSGNAFPDEYENTLFITLHGSWNKMDHPSGYTVVAVSTDKNGGVTGYKEFITGWLQGKKAWGRPSAPFVMSDGSLLISDDKYNVIYRVTYNSAS
ncbi:MAG: PQQ-dependent sugar dehydrogenase [Gammaproteobacteria bacterium]